MGKIKPPILQSGDTVALIAPARAVSIEEMAGFKQWVELKGLILKEGKQLYGRVNQFSATDSDRAQDFIAAWMDPEVKAVFCARGGYGSMRFVHLLLDAIFSILNNK